MNTIRTSVIVLFALAMHAALAAERTAPTAVPAFEGVTYEAIGYAGPTVTITITFNGKSVQASHLDAPEEFHRVRKKIIELAESTRERPDPASQPTPAGK